MMMYSRNHARDALFGLYLNRVDRTSTARGAARAAIFATTSCLALYGAVLTATTGQAVAQTTASGQASASAGLEEIVVTARRREEKLQSVPITVTAFTAADITAKNIVTGQDLTIFVPSLAINDNVGLGPGFVLRGQGDTIGAGPGVVAYFAEVPLISGQTAIGEFQGGAGPGLFYDLENIQALQGPQGTLFGRNTTGGAILITPQKPTNAFEGYGQITIGSYNWHEFEGAINVPIVSDKVLLRLSTDISMRDGYTKDVGPFFPGKDYDNRDYWSFRGSLVLRPTDDFENYTIVSSRYSHTNGPGGSLHGADTKTGILEPFGAAAVDAYLAAQDARGPRETSLSDDQKYKEWNYGVVNVSRFDLSENLTLKNIAGFQVDLNSIGFTDRDYTSFARQDIVMPPGRQWANASEQYDDELQLSGKSLNDKLTWVIGGFLEFGHPIGQPGFDVNSAMDGAGPGMPFLYTIDIKGGVTERSQAVYGQATYDLGDLWSALDGLKLTGGYRYTWDYKSAFSSIVIPAFGNLCAIGPGLGPNCILSQNGHFHAPTWTAGLDYQVTPNTLVYVTGRRGYKSGGFNLSLAAENSPFADFKPELVTDVEIGAKSDWEIFGMKARTNIDAYHTDYSDIQTTITVTLNNLATPITENAASATIEGVEFQGTLLPVAGTELTVDWSFMAAKFNSYFSPIGGDLSGIQFNYAPKNTLTATARYHLPIPEELGDLSLAAIYSVRSEENGGATDFFQSSRIQGYSLLNLRADWKGVYGLPLDVSLFATNVTDKLYVTQNAESFAPQGILGLNYGEPRMIGAQIRYHFGEEPAPAETASTYVPPPVAAPAPSVPKSYLVFFDFNKSDLTPQATEIVDQAAKNAGPAKVTQLTVTGHTDTVGSDAYNMRLSRRRAESVAVQLEKDGIPSSEIEIVAKGKRDLLVPTADGVREPQNRRVQIVYSGGPTS
jgi:iron complex outermembrane receptor protein